MRIGTTKLMLGLFVGAALLLGQALTAPAEAAQRNQVGSAKTSASAEARTVRVPTLRRPVARGETITESDLLWVESNARRLPRTALTEADDLVGMSARRYLSAGRAILARDVTPPLAVRKGDLVTIVYTTPFMTLTARGRVLEDAPAGQAVRTLNAHSKSLIEATAIAPGIVAARPISHHQLAEAFR